MAAAYNRDIDQRTRVDSYRVGRVVYGATFS